MPFKIGQFASGFVLGEEVKEDKVFRGKVSKVEPLYITIQAEDGKEKVFNPVLCRRDFQYEEWFPGSSDVGLGHFIFAVVSKDNETIVECAHMEMAAYIATLQNRSLNKEVNKSESKDP